MKNVYRIKRNTEREMREMIKLEAEANTLKLRIWAVGILIGTVAMSAVGFWILTTVSL